MLEDVYKRQYIMRLLSNDFSLVRLASGILAARNSICLLYTSHGGAAELFEGQPHGSLYFRLYLILFVELCAAFIAVSYTHLDVYKRQAQRRAHGFRSGFLCAD